MFRRMLRVLVLIASIMAMGVYALGVWQTFQHQPTPVPLEQGLFAQVNRIGSDEPVYSEPSLSSASVPMPGLGVLMATLLGDAIEDVWNLRLIVLATWLVVSLLVVAIVHLETGSWTLGFAATGFSILGLALFGSSPGLVQPEPLYLLLALLGFLVFRFTHGAWGSVIGGALLGAAVFVHVQAAWFLLGAWVALSLEEGRRLLAFALTVFVVLGGGYIWLSLLYGPWFNYAAWDAAIQSARFSLPGALHFTTDQVLGTLGVCTVIAALSYAMSTPPWYGKKGMWMCFGVAAITGGLFATQSAHPDPNAIFATVVAASLLGALSIQRVISHLSASFDDEGSQGESALLSVLLLQFVVLFSSVSTEPWAADAMASLGIGR